MEHLFTSIIKPSAPNRRKQSLSINLELGVKYKLIYFHLKKFVVKDENINNTGKQDKACNDV